MKKLWKQNILPFGVMLLGIVGYMLRSGLYAAGVDAKNLLVRGHPLEIALWVCTAAAALLAVLDGFARREYSAFDAGFGRSILSTLGHILAASGILLTALLRQDMMDSPVTKLWKLAGLVCAPMLLWAAFSRAAGKRPFFGVYAVCSVFFALHLVSNYQSWCADPQLQNYVFSFLGTLLLMLFAYYQCAFCTDNGKSRLQRLTGLLAMYCCLTALAGTQDLVLYLGCGLWAGTGLCVRQASKKEKAGGEDEPA